jgi:CheY-like chemotaxis protein
LIATVVDDMFFAAKIRAAAENAGRTIKALKSREQLEACLREATPALVIVDLNSSRLDPLEAIRLVKSAPQTSSIPIVAFGSHVEVELMREAQQAGCDRVLPRSSFSQLLPSIVAE